MYHALCDTMDYIEPALPYIITGLAAVLAACAIDWYTDPGPIDWEDIVLRGLLYIESGARYIDTTQLSSRFNITETSINVYDKNDMKLLTNSWIPFTGLVCDRDRLTAAKYNHIFQKLGVRPKISYRQLCRIDNVDAVCIVTTGDVYTLINTSSQVQTQE